MFFLLFQGCLFTLINVKKVAEEANTLDPKKAETTCTLHIRTCKTCCNAGYTIIFFFISFDFDYLDHYDCVMSKQTFPRFAQTHLLFQRMMLLICSIDVSVNETVHTPGGPHTM